MIDTSSCKYSNFHNYNLKKAVLHLFNYKKFKFPLSNDTITHMGLDVGNPGPEVVKLFSYSTQLSIKFQLLIKTKMLLNSQMFVFILPINVKRPRIVGILTFMSRIIFMLS